MDIFDNFSSNFKLLGELSPVVNFRFLLALAKDCGLIKRFRKIHPLIFIKAYLDATREGGRKPSIGAIWRKYNSIGVFSGSKPVSRSAVEKFIARENIAKFASEFIKELEEHLTAQSMSQSADAVKELQGLVKDLDDIIAQDGCEITVNPQAAVNAQKDDPHDQSFKTSVGGAGRKLHAGWSLLHSALFTASITSAVSSERAEIRCDKMGNKLFIADAGYPSLDLFRQLDENGAYFLIKMKNSLKPEVLRAQAFDNGKYLDEVVEYNGERIKLNEDVRFKDKCSYDFIVRSHRKGKKDLIMRILKVYNPYYCDKNSTRDPDQSKDASDPSLNGYCYLATNIPADQLDLAQIYATYRLRWSAEIGFKCLRSGNTLHSGKAIKKTSVDNLLNLSTMNHRIKTVIAAALQPLVKVRMSELLVATESGSLVNLLLEKVCYCPNAMLNSLTVKQFKEAIVDCYKRLGVSRVSKTNKVLGKGVSCTVEILSKPPAPNGGLPLTA